MTPERWQQVKDLLEKAEEQPAARRRAWLREIAAGDAGLVREVESLLVFESELEGFIEEPVLAAVSRAVGELEALSAGERIGPYRLVRLLGRGGMGAVYLAAREEDFEQRVALKLLAPGKARAEAIRRFEAERQILARLEHPNIARLLDGGTTADGTPYFAMEVVEGLPIDLYCEEKKLAVEDRLKLFLAICSALQLAHQSLVIHRDLKPGNILVDAAGVPKLLDFGIAKLLRGDGSSEAAAARTEQIFTLHYASPEQVKGEPIGTTSDVYSLGVVMYQVLAGQLPSGLDQRTGHFELLRAICEDEPQPASAVASVAAGGGEPVPVKTLRRRLAGDVDAILAKALRKEPARRYASVQSLADDIRRHLEHQPVAARQGNLPYHLGKYLRRHRFALASAALIGLLACGFTLALLHQLRETEQARDRAEGVSSFLIDLFQAAAPDRPAGEEPTLRQLIARGRQNLEAGLEKDPQTRAILQLKLGEVYLKLGDYPEAQALLESAIEIWRREPGSHSELASALSGLAGVHFARGDVARSEALLRESIALRRRAGFDEDLLKPLGSLATLLVARGELAEAEEIYRESLARRRAILGPRHQNVATSLRSLAIVLKSQGRNEEAESLLKEALSIREQVFGPDSAPAAHVLASLGGVSRELGRLEEAQAQLEKALAIYRGKLGDQHLDTARAKKDLAELLIERGDPGGCGLLAEAAASLRAIRPADDKDVGEAAALLAACPGPTE